MSAVAIRRLVILLSFSFFGRLRAIAWKIARCQFETQKTYPIQSVLFSPRTREFMQLCMKAAGYKWANRATIATSDIPKPTILT